MSSNEVGKVLGTADSEPLNFWVAVREDQLVQLDDVLMLRRRLPNGESVSVYGIVDQMVARHEGAKFESDVFLCEEGILPLTHAVKAHITVTRVEPEIFVPPLPGQAVYRAEGADRDMALFFDAMKKRFPLGVSRDGEIIHGNFEFLDGTRGAHINISGVSGVATKTTYATFLLYGIFHSDLLGSDVINTKAIIFNVKGEDLLYLDKPNASLPPEAYKTYEKLGLPVGAFEDVALYAPVQKGLDVLLPDTQTRKENVIGYCWTIEEFCKGRYLRFLFADADDETSHLSALVERIEAELAANWQEFRGLDDFAEVVMQIKNSLSMWAHSFAPGTVSSFVRRLESAAHRVGHLIRGAVAQPDRHRIDWSRAQVSVIDIHNLHDRAKRFVIGVVLKRMFEEKEATGSARPLVFVVLDELNKYAPREGSSPIKEVILDMAERGRSLGIILIGAQQTASQIERRVVGNSAYRVVGRLDLAEAQQTEYAFLPQVSRARAGILKPGTIIVSQPEIPIPLLAQFPFPAWATRPSEVAKSSSDDAFSALRKKKT